MVVLGFKKILSLINKLIDKSYRRIDRNEKVVLGSIIFFWGILSIAILFGGSMANEWNVNGQFSVFWNISQYGLMPILYPFIAVAIVGLVIALWGLIDKNGQKDRVYFIEKSNT